MNSKPENQNDGHHCCDTDLIFSAAKLGVYRHERLAHTEPPHKKPVQRRVSRRAALLKTMAAWALAHF